MLTIIICFKNNQVEKVCHPIEQKFIVYRGYRNCIRCFGNTYAPWWKAPYSCFCILFYFFLYFSTKLISYHINSRQITSIQKFKIFLVRKMAATTEIFKVVYTLCLLHPVFIIYTNSWPFLRNSCIDMSQSYHRKFFDFYCFVHLRKPTDIPLKATFAIPNRYGYYCCSSFKIQIMTKLIIKATVYNWV